MAHKTNEATSTVAVAVDPFAKPDMKWTLEEGGGTGVDQPASQAAVADTTSLILDDETILATPLINTNQDQDVSK